MGFVTITVYGRFSSWNKIYSLNSYWRRKVIVDGIHTAVLFALLEQKLPKILFTNRVTITVKQFFNKSPYDSDNIPAKIYIDPLKGYLFPDDSIVHVASVTTEAFLDKLGAERVEIHIIENSSEL